MSEDDGWADEDASGNSPHADFFYFLSHVYICYHGFGRYESVLVRSILLPAILAAYRWQRLKLFYHTSLFIIIFAIAKLDSIQYKHYLTLLPLRYQTYKLHEKDSGFSFLFSMGRLGICMILK